jgi:asparagine synthase (glutamine-hydrolysing)
MSGICGWVSGSRDGERGEVVLDRMAGKLAPAGPAHDGSIVGNHGGLAIRRGIVPVNIHREGALVVAIQGHIRFALSRAEQGAATSPAVTLAQIYREHGSECLRHLSGPCAIAIIDTEAARGLLAIDRLGVRGLCYATRAAELVFGSTADSVASHPDVGARLDRQALFNYLYCHVVPSPGTIYRSVHKLLPGECITFENGTTHKRFYWTLRYSDDARPIASLEGDFHRLLRSAVERSVNGDAAIGSFLSGGTDSSTVAGLLTELRGSPAKTYSIGFAAQGFDEIAYARITARHFKTAAREYYVTPEDVMSALPIIADVYDEPFGNSSAVPTYFCARMAHEDGVKVMLAGDGGDEIFGGNARYAKQKLFEVYGLLPAALRHRVIEPLALHLPGGEIAAPLRKVKSYIEQAAIPLPERLETYNFIQRAPLADIFEADFLADIDPAQPLSLMQEVYARTTSRAVVNRMMHLDLKLTLADNDLRKVSRMGEAAGVEVRYPLLDEELVEFSGRIPASLKVKGVKLRYFFKRALRDFLPPETLAKTKHGFGLPFGLWLREHPALASFARESLSSFQSRGIVKPAYVEELMHRHEIDHATYFGTMIWVIVALERWLLARGL